MDTKSLAKSKRSHTQHHTKKHHPKQTSKAPSTGSVGAASSQKPTGKQIREKPRQSQGSNALPTNWDRYGDEYESNSENPSEDSTSQLTDDIVPKSKGADYCHLISEAESQAQINYSTESFPSFDDVFTDFNLGVGSLLSVRGQSILSWIEDDNFVVEDKATGRQEASFLSMDLNALAEQLAKVDISQRLFIEADLLPPELYTEEIQANIEQESCKDEVPLKSEAAKKEGSGLSDGAKQNERYIEVIGTSAMDHPVKGEIWESRTDKSFMPESIAQFSVISAATSRFEAAHAEAELDVLLDSFSEPEILKSAVFREEPSYISNTSQADASTSGLVGISSKELVPTLVKNGPPDLSKSALAVDLDDSLDDLLKETSSRINQNFATRSHEVKAAYVNVDVVSSPSSGPISKSKLLDDFDSWLDTI